MRPGRIDDQGRDAEGSVDSVGTSRPRESKHLRPPHMTDYYDTLETRDPELRERTLLARLPLQVEYAKKSTPAFARILADIDARAIDTREALAALPVTRKSALLELQK